jgi:mitogen-activated protein kinase 1/3
VSECSKSADITPRTTCSSQLLSPREVIINSELTSGKDIVGCSDLLDISVSSQRDEDPISFQVPGHFHADQVLGSGAYGTVAAFDDACTGQRVAIKKCENALTNVADGKRVAREVQVLRGATHRNIVKLYGAYCSITDAYIVQELMDSDLHYIIRNSARSLSATRCTFIVHEILQGVRYLHRIGIVHRDLKPSNVLMNVDTGCDDEEEVAVKLCDFNLSRGGLEGGDVPRNASSASLAALATKAADRAELSEYVATRWYRAPEIMLLKGSYGKPIDLWAVGCIFCELLRLKPIFPGKDNEDQLRRIASTLRLPNEQLLSGADFVLAGLSATQHTPWSDLLPNASLEVVQAIAGMLQLDPEMRLTAKECLSQVCFAPICSSSNVQEDVQAERLYVERILDHIGTSQRMHHRKSTRRLDTH